MAIADYLKEEQSEDKEIDISIMVTGATETYQGIKFLNCSTKCKYLYKNICMLFDTNLKSNKDDLFIRTEQCQKKIR